MADVRTTITIQQELYSGVKSRYRQLGFNKMADLINTALKEYLQRSSIQEKNLAMQRAAASESYRAQLALVSEDFRYPDQDFVHTDY